MKSPPAPGLSPGMVPAPLPGPNAPMVKNAAAESAAALHRTHALVRGGG